MKKHGRYSAVPVSEKLRQIGEAFRDARIAADLTQHEVAEGIGRALNVVRYHEGGVRALRLDDVMRAAEVMRCDPRTLVPDLGAGEAAGTQGGPP